MHRAVPVRLCKHFKGIFVNSNRIVFFTRSSTIHKLKHCLPTKGKSGLVHDFRPNQRTSSRKVSSWVVVHLNHIQGSLTKL